MAPPYTRIRWIGIYFGSRDDAHFRRELQTTANVFQQRFGCSVEVWQIPSGRCDVTGAVADQIRTFKDRSRDKNELLIVMYGGHGTVDPPIDVKSSTRSLLWVSSDQYVRWNEIQDDILFPGDKDTLVILDCCYAGAAERTGYVARKDVLAACAWNKRTPMRNVPQSPKSFTSYLLWAICGFAVQFTIAQLYSAIVALGPAQQPVYQSLPANPTHDIILTPVQTGRSGNAIIPPQNTLPTGGNVAAQGISHIDIVIGFGRWSFKIRIWFGSEARSRAGALGNNAEQDSFIEPVSSEGIQPNGAYSQQNDSFFRVGRTFALPWSDETVPPQALPVSTASASARNQEVSFRVVRSGNGAFHAIAGTSARHSIQSGKVYTMSSQLLVRDLGMGSDAQTTIATSDNRRNDAGGRPSNDVGRPQVRPVRGQESSAAPRSASEREVELLNDCLRAGYTREQLRDGIAVRMQRGMNRAQALDDIAAKLGIARRPDQAAQRYRGRDDPEEEDSDDEDDDDSDEAEYSD